MRSVVQPGDVVVDVGAYKGGYTYWMRDAVGSSGRVFAFEPQAELAERLRRTVEAFGWENVSIHRTALSDRAGSAPLYVPGRSSPRASLEWERVGARSDEVEVERLDDVLEANGLMERVTFVKVDAEGHELAILRGAARTLTTARPRLIVECEERHTDAHSVAEVVEYLSRVGYAGTLFAGNARIPAAEFDAERHQRPGLRPYANNFAFEAS